VSDDLQPETNPQGILVREFVVSGARASLNLIGVMTSTYYEYKKCLEILLDGYLSEAKLTRLQEIRVELVDLIHELEQNSDEANDPDITSQASMRLVQISLDLNAISGLAKAADPINTSLGLLAYNQAETLASREYEKLNIREAISLFPKTIISLGIITLGFYAVRFFPLVRSALAAGQENSHAQAIDVAIYVLLGVLVFGISGLMYAGYFAKTKNKAAAQVVNHFMSFFLGSFLGFLAKLGGSGG
jgi:hypothetical protein